MATNKQEASKEISKHVEDAYDSIKKAEDLADKFGIEFGFSLEYGMGGTYYPKANPDTEATEEEDDWKSSYEGWQSSSSMC